MHREIAAQSHEQTCHIKLRLTRPSCLPVESIHQFRSDRVDQIRQLHARRLHLWHFCRPHRPVSVNEVSRRFATSSSRLGIPIDVDDRYFVRCWW